MQLYTILTGSTCVGYKVKVQVTTLLQDRKIKS